MLRRYRPNVKVTRNIETKLDLHWGIKTHGYSLPGKYRHRSIRTKGGGGKDVGIFALVRGLETKWKLDQGYILLIWKVLDRRYRELGSIDVMVLGPAK